MHRSLYTLSAALLPLLTAAPLFAQDTPAPAPSPMGGLGSMLPMLLFMFVIIYFLMIRPEQKKQKERQKLLAAIKKGDKVMTAAGMYGTVINVKETTVTIKIAENTVVEFAKSAVASVINVENAEVKDEKK